VRPGVALARASRLDVCVSRCRESHQVSTEQDGKRKEKWVKLELQFL
jgi:hypothetical protein